MKEREKGKKKLLLFGDDLFQHPPTHPTQKIEGEKRRGKHLCYFLR